MRAPEPTNPPPHLADRIRAERGGLEGERKQVTILFADLVDSMEVARGMDPEDWRSIVNRFFGVLADGVHELEGTVDSFTGDGIMAIFGAPIAHEDHALRACLAALKLREDVAAYSQELRESQGVDLTIRIGLNSGEVVVGTIGDRGDMAYTAVGHTVGLAQRMEQTARPGGICLSPSTAALAEGYVRLKEPVVHEIKGAGRMESFELEAAAGALGSIEAVQSRGLTPLIGRDDELQTLETAFEASLAGHGQLVGVVGEPGIGKSRLCFEFAERCRRRGIPVFQVAAQAHQQGVPLLPVLTLLRSYFEIADVPDEEARSRIQTRLEALGEGLGDEAPLLLDFLGIADPERPVERMDVEARQRRLLDLVRRLIYAQSTQQPALTIFDDLHWIDPASEAFLQAYAEAAQGTRGLTLMTFRPEYSAPWMSRSYYRQIPLAALHGQNENQLITELLGDDASVTETGELISRRAEGNPFFAEELVRSLAGSGHLLGEPGGYRVETPITAADMPATVHAVLAARIDRLPAPRKAVLEAAAVLGKEFPAPLLARLTDLDDPALDEELRALVAAEFLFERTPGPEPLYAFRHPLTQEVAYRSQLHERRDPLHAAAAAAIAEHYSDQLDERASLVATHWERAGEGREAAAWHARAATWSGFNDPGEALRHWRRVVELSDEMPASEERDALALGSRMAALQFGWRLGIGLEDAEALFRDAERIASKIEQPRLHALLLSGYGAVKGLGQGEVREYADLSRRAIEIGDRSGDRDLQVVLGTNGYAFYLTGAYEEGREVVDRAIARADGDPRAGSELPVVACPYALCHLGKAQMLADLGDLAEAERILETGNSIAREQNDLETVAISTSFGTHIALAAGETEVALERATTTVEVSQRIGGPFTRAWAWASLGAAELARRNPLGAIDALERAEAIATEHRAAEEGRVYRLAHLAEAEAGAGSVERARELATRALEIAQVGKGPPIAIPACLAWLRVELGSDDPAHPDRIESVLRFGLGLVAETRARRWEPLLRVEAARNADRAGDRERCDEELDQARRLFAEIGASAHAERLASLEASAIPGGSAR